MVKIIVRLNILMKYKLSLLQNSFYIRRHKLPMDEKGYEKLRKECDSSGKIAAWIEEKIHYIEDGLLDFPQKPLLTFTLRAGDCEDFARLAADLLVGIGIECKIIDMYFLDERRIGGHSVCAFKSPVTGLWDFIGTEGMIPSNATKPEYVSRNYSWNYINIAVRRANYALEYIV
jgi:hypothetical protein